MKKPLLIKCGIAILILMWLGTAAYFYINPTPMGGFKDDINKTNQFIEGFMKDNSRLPSDQEYWSKYGSNSKIEYIINGDEY
jgi:hypothetical protein